MRLDQPFETVSLQGIEVLELSRSICAMRSKGLAVGDHAKVDWCAIFTTPNPLKLRTVQESISLFNNTRAMPSKLYIQSNPAAPKDRRATHLQTAPYPP
jgi:hypothetical protein